MTAQNIIIVGGGPAGAAVGRALSAKIDNQKFKILLITERDNLIHLPAGLRMIVDEQSKLEDTAIIPYNKNFITGNGTVKQGKVSTVEKDSSGKGGVVVLENGDRISFSYLVVATGSSWEGPLVFPNTKPEMVAKVNDWRQKFSTANSIVIVGGGAVGLELSGELRDKYPKKAVTVVHSAALPLNDAYPTKFRKAVLAGFKARDIKLVLNDRIEEIPPTGYTSVTTAKGTVIEADLVLFARGGKPNTSLLQDLGDVLSPNGYVKVLPTFQLPLHPDIFALGDIADLKEQKQWAKQAEHVNTVTTNILSLIKGQPAKKMYKGGMEMIFLTNGKAGGNGFVDMLWGITLGGRIVTGGKSKELLVPMVRKAVGYV